MWPQINNLFGSVKITNKGSGAHRPSVQYYAAREMSLSPRVSVIVQNPCFKTERMDETDEQTNDDQPSQSSSRKTQAPGTSVSVIQVNNGSKSAEPKYQPPLIRQILPPKRARKGPAPKLFGSERCTICDSKATGFHYNVLSCEGCKNFFRRAIIKGLIYHCKPGNQVCCVEHNFRPRCQWCRLDKCYGMGMRAEYINRTRPKLSATPQNVLPERIENLVTTVKRSWETATEGVEKPKLASYLSNHSGSHDDYEHVAGIEKKRLDFFLEMAFFKTRRIIKFMNFLPGVHNLSRDTRIWLFKESLAESMVMFNATTYNATYERRDGTTEEAVRWLDGEWRGKTDFYKCGLRMELVEPMFEIWRRLNQLKLDKVVCSLLMVLILINPDRNMPPHMKCELEKLNTIQEQYIEALQVYFEKKYRRKASTLLGHSMSILSNLRDISARSLAVQLGQLHKMECQMPELLARLFSYDNSIDIIGTSH